MLEKTRIQEGRLGPFWRSQMSIVRQPQRLLPSQVFLRGK